MTFRQKERAARKGKEPRSEIEEGGVKEGARHHRKPVPTPRLSHGWTCEGTSGEFFLEPPEKEYDIPPSPRLSPPPGINGRRGKVVHSPPPGFVAGEGGGEKEEGGREKGLERWVIAGVGDGRAVGWKGEDVENRKFEGAHARYEGGGLDGHAKVCYE